MQDIDPKGMVQLVEGLLEEYRRQPHLTPETIRSLPGYRGVIERAQALGFTGSELVGDEDFAHRSPAWVARADLAELQAWMHSTLRAERWNSEWPTAILEALRGGHLKAMAHRLNEIAASAGNE